jgi:CHAT domain-containing protein
VPLGPAVEIDALVEQWRRAIVEGRAALPVVRSAAEQRYREIAADLRRAIWDPIAVETRGAGRVFVVADGALHLLNLDTLVQEDGRYLAETAPVFHYLSTERDLVPPAGAVAAGRGLLVVGGPDFDRGARAPLAPLPGSRREADAVAAMWEAPEEVTRLSGREASEQAVKRAAPGSLVVHLATHGFVIEDPAPAADSRLEPYASALASTPGSEAPVLSGLAFAGPSARHPAADSSADDGVLTDLEVASLDLDGVDWVVLSGCETGVGTPRAGEGVLGLRRSFQIAGAERLVMSLWSVEDAATETWMRHLYEARSAGASAADAVRRASLESIRGRRERGESTHPFYWGAFVAVGRP